jgi:hypothetical protein
MWEDYIGHHWKKHAEKMETTFFILQKSCLDWDWDGRCLPNIHSIELGDAKREKIVEIMYDSEWYKKRNNCITASSIYKVNN